MLPLYQNIKNRRLELGMSQQELAEKMGYTSRSTIAKIESGRNDIPQSKIVAFAAALNTTPAILMGWETDSLPSNVFPLPETKKVPLLGDIACGEPIFAEEQYGEYVECNISADFCLRAKGDSMTGARIQDGDIVFIRKQEMVQNGEIAAVLIDDEATLKRVYYYPEKGKIVLTPENPKYEPLVYIGEELNEIRILGKAVAFQSNVE